MTPYEQLRTRCNVLLPDRLKLEFGCEVRRDRVVDIINDVQGTGDADIWKYWTKRGHKFYSDAVRDGKVFHGALIGEGEWWEILGKPLTIEDVLRAMPPMYSMQIFQDGSGHAIYDGEDVDDGYFHFDLTKPLSDPANEPAVLAVLKLLS